MLKKPSSSISHTLREIMIEQPPGSWVAVSLDQKSVVGVGPTPDQAKLVGMAHGELDLILLRVPNRNVAALTEYEDALLKAHNLHIGVYRRLAVNLGVDPSYVSRVANGNREEPKIRRALLNELHKIHRSVPLRKESKRRKHPQHQKRRP
jgi:hypothetical protein